MRNVLVHDYFEVDFETVWLVVTRDLPPLGKAMGAVQMETTFPVDSVLV